MNVIYLNIAGYVWYDSGSLLMALLALGLAMFLTEILRHPLRTLLILTGLGLLMGCNDNER